MTLIVAGIQDGSVWMCGDTAVTDPAASLRARNYWPKIQTPHGRSLVGFAGSLEIGLDVMSALHQMEPGAFALDVLLRVHLKGGVDFLYGYLSEGAVRLARVAGGKVEHSTSYFIGSQPDYELFQEVRLARAAEHSPDAVHTFICGAIGDLLVPDGLGDATGAMLEQFSTSERREVGGWAMPFFLTSAGVFQCTYAYSVSDPITADLSAGATIPHGTTEGGGYGLSYSPFSEGDGFAVYWLQKPGGKIFLRDGNSYVEYDFDGGPSQFRFAVKERLGRDVGVWFGDRPLGQVSEITPIADAAGDRMNFVRSGRDFSFTWANNPSGSFKVGGTFEIPAEDDL